ncbi:hypothetical protein NDU88_008100 [Pleurodeles waltl]|uniref:Uncharacterized protein n=1 Tax=Pleurodeles waltl TaxID=8319 RepID=A0AAV7U2D6_PLEWA|nr:hypothetical protein NDU88_008100 [Pleurodeles waltl]
MKLSPRNSKDCCSHETQQLKPQSQRDRLLRQEFQSERLQDMYPGHWKKHSVEICAEASLNKCQIVGRKQLAFVPVQKMTLKDQRNDSLQSLHLEGDIVDKSVQSFELQNQPEAPFMFWNQEDYGIETVTLLRRRDWRHRLLLQQGTDAQS